jgi:hypothetical protein
LVSVTSIVHTRNPCINPRRANTACALTPTDLSAVAIALERLICNSEAVALDIAGTIGIEPVIFCSPGYPIIDAVVIFILI